MLLKRRAAQPRQRTRNPSPVPTHRATLCPRERELLSFSLGEMVAEVRGRMRGLVIHEMLCKKARIYELAMQGYGLTVNPVDERCWVCRGARSIDHASISTAADFCRSWTDSTNRS
jgi:hypothetical protein